MARDRDCLDELVDERSASNPAFAQMVEAAYYTARGGPPSARARRDRALRTAGSVQPNRVSTFGRTLPNLRVDKPPLI